MAQGLVSEDEGSLSTGSGGFVTRIRFYSDTDSISILKPKLHPKNFLQIQYDFDPHQPRNVCSRPCHHHQAASDAVHQEIRPG